jgi:aspartate/glutamate racemase
VPYENHRPRGRHELGIHRLVSYYRLINEAVEERLGGLHSARCVLYSVDFAEVEALQRECRVA